MSTHAPCQAIRHHPSPPAGAAVRAVPPPALACFRPRARSSRRRGRRPSRSKPSPRGRASASPPSTGRGRTPTRWSWPRSWNRRSRRRRTDSQGSALAALRRQLRDIAGDVRVPHRTERDADARRRPTPRPSCRKPFGTTSFSRAAKKAGGCSRRPSRMESCAAELDLDVTLDLLYGPIFFRILVGHAPADERFCERLLDQLVGGLARPKARSKRVRHLEANT